MKRTYHDICVSEFSAERRGYGQYYFYYRSPNMRTLWQLSSTDSTFADVILHDADVSRSTLICMKAKIKHQGTRLTPLRARHLRQWKGCVWSL